MRKRYDHHDEGWSLNYKDLVKEKQLREILNGVEV